MSKKLLLLFVGLALITSIFYYLGKPKSTSTLPYPVETPSEDTQLTTLPGDWQTYISPEWGFAINYPSDAKLELTQNGAHFLKLGPTQALGTELFDGLSLLIFTAELNNKKFDDFVLEEYNKVKKEPAITSVSELEKTNVSTFNGYKFTVEGLGKSTAYYLEKEPSGYIKITDMTVEPQNEGRDFHKSVNTMLNSLQIVNPSTNSAENAPTGSLHNLPVPKAVSATKEFAAADLNVPSNKILVLSAYEEEWTNACLELEEEGEICAQVITPGYQITIEANGKQRIYRTNSDGSIIKIEK